MKEWKNVLISPTTSILKAVEIIDKSSLQIALVVDESRRLLGTVTDGDIRRGILEGLSLEEPVKKVMCHKPTFISLNEDPEKVKSIIKLKGIHQIPILDEDGCVVGMEVVENLIREDLRENWVVIMAGGLGTRLRPLTDNYPKSLLKVGKKSILETILEHLIFCGFRRFYISINYKAEIIRQHFGDGSGWGVEIRYLQEQKRLGTAGSLALIPGRNNLPLLVMNGDILTKVNFRQLLDFHTEHQVKATMCVREYHFQVAYGVVKINKHFFESIEEKPVHRFFINAGIYVLEPDILELIPKNKFFDMPTLFNKLLAQGSKPAAFPIREYWLDVGQIKDYEQANWDMEALFE